MCSGNDLQWMCVQAVVVSYQSNHCPVVGMQGWVVVYMDGFSCLVKCSVFPCFHVAALYCRLFQSN